MSEATDDGRRAAGDGVASVGGRQSSLVLERLTPLLVIVGVFLVWEVGQRLSGWPPEFIAPLPSAALQFTVARAGFLLSNLAVTLAEAAGGFTIGNVLAVALAVVCVYNRTVERVVMPFALAVRSIPLIALTPVLIFLLGFEWQSKVAVAALICFFPTLVNMIVGLRSVDHRQFELMHVLNASTLQVFLRLRFPSSVPSFFAALRIAVPSSILGAAVAEWINASAGIGYLIIVSTYQFNTVQLYATMLITTLASAAAYLAVIGLERWLIPWRRHLPAT